MQSTRVRPHIKTSSTKNAYINLNDILYKNNLSITAHQFYLKTLLAKNNYPKLTKGMEKSKSEISVRENICDSVDEKIKVAPPLKHIYKPLIKAYKFNETTVTDRLLRAQTAIENKNKNTLNSMRNIHSSLIFSSPSIKALDKFSLNGYDLGTACDKEFLVQSEKKVYS